MMSAMSAAVMEPIRSLDILIVIGQLKIFSDMDMEIAMVMVTDMDMDTVMDIPDSIREELDTDFLEKQEKNNKKNNKKKK